MVFKKIFLGCLIFIFIIINISGCAEDKNSSKSGKDLQANAFIDPDLIYIESEDENYNINEYLTEFAPTDISDDETEKINDTTEPAELFVITPSGKKYHNENCRTVGERKEYITRDEAEKKGYAACKICQP